MRKTPILFLPLFAAACDMGGGNSSAGPTPTSTPSGVVRYDPSFKGVSGGWKSADGSAGPGRIVQIDVSSAGDYSIDVRGSKGGVAIVMETGRGTLSWSGETVQAKPSETHGDFLKRLGAWSADVSATPRRSMSLHGADGSTVVLAR